MEDSLKNLAAALEPPKELVDKAKEISRSIFEILQEKSKFHVVRFKLVGGLAKRTSTRLKAEVDMVVYFKDPEKKIKRTEVLSEWTQILAKEKYLDMRETSFLLAFVWQGFPVDLVAVRDSVVRGFMPTIEELRNDIEEVKRFMDPMAKDLTLSWQSKRFMKNKTPIAVEVARLAKFWAQTVLFDGTVGGKSYIFEVLAVRAVSLSRESILGGFTQFLDLVEGIQSSRIIFSHSNGDWYESKEISREILCQWPLIVDPVNPFSNLLDLEKSVKERFFREFSNAASETLARLRSSGGGLSDVFKPQPKLERLDYPLKLTDVTIKVNNGTWKFARMSASNLDAIFESDLPKFTQFLKSLLLNVSSVVFVKTWESRDDKKNYDEDDADINVAVAAAEIFFGYAAGKWETKGKSCTFQIPILRGRCIGVEFNLSNQRKRKFAESAETADFSRRKR